MKNRKNSTFIFLIGYGFILLFCSCTSAIFFQSMDSDIEHQHYYEQKLFKINLKIDSISTLFKLSASDSSLSKKVDSLILIRSDLERIIERDRKSIQTNSQRGIESSPVKSKRN